MKPTWIIQTNIDDIDTKPLIKEVTHQGMEVIYFRHDSCKDLPLDMFRPEDCVIYYGSIDFMRLVKSGSSSIPGGWCNFENMKCSTYYSYFGAYILNRQYSMMPIGDLIRRWESICVYTSLLNSGKLLSTKIDRVVQTCGSLFVRPNSGTKPFTGHVLRHDQVYRLESLIQMVGPETLVVISPEKHITGEWRYIICEGKVVAGSKYLPEETCAAHAPSLRLATVIASQEWQPDICYTVDICESGGEMHLLEINSFSSAGFYKSNLFCIVDGASRAAVREWEDYRDPNN